MGTLDAALNSDLGLCCSEVILKESRDSNTQITQRKQRDEIFSAELRRIFTYKIHF